VGELNIGGDGLALGYFGQPDLTASVFRPVSLHAPNGDIQVLEWQDTQIKMRGFRIELEEIETRLRAAPGVAAAAVALKTRQNGDAQLVAYQVPEPGAAVDPGDVGARLRDELPGYMVPAGWVVLGSLPQTANAKLDRKALPDPDKVATVTPLKIVAKPVSDTEQRIMDIWQSVPGRDEISVTDTLFEIGADSLSVFRIAAQLIDAGLNLDARSVLADPSIRGLATYADARGTVEPAVAPFVEDLSWGRGGTERRRRDPPTGPPPGDITTAAGRFL
jgi:hypothetical protein